MSTTIELVSFKLQEGIDEAALQTMYDGVNQFCMQQSGFIYRSICCDDNGVWHDIVYWQDLPSAKKAAEDFGKTEVCQSMDKIIEPGSLSMKHMQAHSETMAEQAA